MSLETLHPASLEATCEPRTDVIDLSIVIVSWNVESHLRACLESIKRQHVGFNLEVIVVDNDSQDGSATMVEDTFPQVSLVRNCDNVGFAGANNQGLALSKGRYVLLLNPDTELHEGCLARTIEYADEHPALGAIGCRAIKPDGSQQSTLYRSLRLRDVLVNVLVPTGLRRRSHRLGGFRYAGIDLDMAHEVETIAGCFMLVRREAYEQAGGMDETFFMYGEEAEWCWRLRQEGWSIGYCPDTSILHHGGVSAAQCLDEMNLAMARSQLLLLQRTRGIMVAWIANALMLLRDAPRAATWCLVRPFVMHRGATKWSLLMRSAVRFRLHCGGLFRLDWSS
ncbi:MAG: glycosyltransferase family 2 protein [Planctomycetota bacterium]|nr:glycosyltransferase family 2 protein [Planctomycetota bacterium]